MLIRAPLPAYFIM